MENTIDPHNELMPPKRNTPRDIFLHLLAMITLYWSAVSFITLLWQYINYVFPDNLYYNYGFSGSMRFAMASLLIVFPVFLVTSWVLRKIYWKETSVRDSQLRRGLIYLTLFIAAIVVIVDLVYVINAFLGGEITSRFILKALSVLLVAGAIFGYYLADIRRTVTSKTGMVASGVAAVIVLVSVVGAFWVVGSPMTARKAQFDQQRISDLQNIQWQVVNYWQRKEALPAALADLNDALSGSMVPVDPETKQSYEYKITDAANLKFELCATFALKGSGNDAFREPSISATFPAYGLGNETWNHDVGRTCFERTIDPQLYPPTKQ